MRNRRWRVSNSSKSTWWASKSGPSVQAKRVTPSTVTRHDPHMPVPSTMIVFSDTIVWTPAGRVTSAQARIITIGPMATARSGGSAAATTSARASVTRPGWPKLPSSVHTIRSSAHSARRSVQNCRSAERKPTIAVVRHPACLNALSWGNTGATPRPPPTSTTWRDPAGETGSISVGMPRGPTKSANSSPSS